MPTFTINDYPAAFQELWQIDRLPELGPGTPNEAVRSALEQLTPSLFPQVRHRPAAMACISGLWLYHDFLDESHTISQDIHEWYGSYWHAIMHRREPDAWNSKYWFRKVPHNAVYTALAATHRYDPIAFVDRCEAERGRGTDLERLCQEIQRREMQLLFDLCFRIVVGE